MTSEELVHSLTAALASVAERAQAILDADGVRLWTVEYLRTQLAEIRRVALAVIHDLTQPREDPLEIFATALRSIGEDVRTAQGCGVRPTLTALSEDRLRIALARIGEPLDD